MDPIPATDDLTRAVSKWFKTAVLQLDEERLKTLRACLHSEQTEVRVVACFRAGAVILEVINRADGTRSELFREDVGPLPLDDSGFVDFRVAGTEVSGEFRCSDCGYGAVVHRALPPCPMCGGTVWESRPPRFPD